MNLKLMKTGDKVYTEILGMPYGVLQAYIEYGNDLVLATLVGKNILSKDKIEGNNYATIPAGFDGKGSRVYILYRKQSILYDNPVANKELIFWQGATREANIELALDWLKGFMPAPKAGFPTVGEIGEALDAGDTTLKQRILKQVFIRIHDKGSAGIPAILVNHANTWRM